MTLLSDVISIAGYALQLVLLLFLTLGPFRRYLVIFVYCVAQTAQMTLDIWILREFGQSSPQYRTVFWTDAIVVDILLFLLVVALTYRALEGSPLRSKMTRMLILISAIITVLPFVVLRGPLFSTRWFNGTDQILNFGAAVMNLGLWTALIGSKKRDPQLLAITAGLGVRVAAAGVLLGLRHFTIEGGSAREIADMAARLSFVAGTLLWCWAFRPGQPQPSPQPALKTS